MSRRARLAALAALSGIVTAAHAQPPAWIQTSCTPSYCHLADVHFPTAQRGFVIGANRTILRTEDGGATWTVDRQDPPGTEPWYGLAFHQDNLHGFILGNGALRTENGGQTWLPMPSLPIGSWDHADFASSALSVYFGTNGAVAHTPDGGVTWSIRSGYPHCPIVESMDFVTDELGLVSGRRLQPYDQGIYRTTDGGQTWTRVYENVARDVRWLSPVVAEASTSDGTIRSEDAGLTWTLQPGGIAFPPGTAGHVQAGDALVAVTGLGEIFRSVDQGAYWDLVYGPLAELGDEAWAITKAPDGAVWVVGKYGFILRSIDTGLTWTQSSSGMGLLANDLDMFDNALGMAVGGHGYLWRTVDGGRRWVVTRVLDHPLIFGRSEDLNAVDVVDDQFAVVAGGGGLMYRTYDAGQTWENIGYPLLLEGNLGITDICFLDRDNGWMLAGGLYRTFTGGLIWEPVPGVTGVEIHFADPLHGWVLVGNNVIRRTTNGGATWQSSTLPGDPLVLESMTWLDASTGWVVGRFGYCAKSTNGGASWQLQNIGAANSLFDAVPLSASEVWAVGFDSSSNNIIMRSLNGGATWNRWVRSNDSQTLDIIRKRPDGGLHIAGFFGLMLTDRFPVDCAADWDQDGAVGTGDVSAFLVAWFGDLATGGLGTDLDGSGLVTTADLTAFLAEWFAALDAGC
ncbi:MAG TPA: YCF48-related protein [Phycisphaerales bacterium]|nr:YCF48-related protein [Phycisphaerales bacterium]